MEPLIFHEGALPAGYRHSFEVSIFNKESHLRLQSKDGWVSFYVLDPLAQSAEAHIHFFIRDNIAQSPFRSPFGSFEFSASLPQAVLFQFIEFIEQRLKIQKVSRIVIKDPPQHYSDDNITLLTTFLLNRGFHVSNSEISSILTITDTPFSERIHPRKKRKLLQSKKRPFHFEIAEPQRLDEVYGFIEDLRHQKKFRLSLSLTALRETIGLFPEEFMLFTLYHNNTLAGASVAIRVTNGVLYHFMSDYIRKIGESAPGLLLTEGIYDYCMRANIALLDLGTSALSGQPNFKLLNYKTELGAKPSGKFTFTRNL